MLSTKNLSGFEKTTFYNSSMELVENKSISDRYISFFIGNLFFRKFNETGDVSHNDGC